ncbi:MAG: SDR family oxidoreductase [Schleiferiaceae bacterium]|jgi:NAD(P)-dependent dehydrogenase (short-subunit alcohol dehydrogenase family)|nr:SDR family oxidoreductase [Schleiferiaceae bacterium]
MKQLENKVAVITGGAGGIGMATAKLFLEEGAKVFLVEHNEEDLKRAAAELNSDNVAHCTADVSNEEDTKRYVAEAVKTFGKIDVYFNNAGVEGVLAPGTDYPTDAFDKVIAVNLRGVFLGNKHVAPQMNDGGSIIISSSAAGLTGTPGLMAYVASKHGVIGLMRTLAKELAPRGIRVNTINPAPVDNRMMRSIESMAAGGGDTAPVKQAFEAMIPMGRYATSLEIAQSVLFLASDNSKYVTGTTNPIDGGMTA